MSSMKTLQINTQERAVSADINRLQKFKEKDVSELLRFMLDVHGSDDLDAGSVMATPSTLETPLRMEIINGLLVRPQLADFNLLVDAGVAMAMAPDAAADESNYKYVADPGVSTLGALTMSAGDPVDTRIDVIECRLDPTGYVATDNRDIFNPSTGLFVASSVTKEKASLLQYRVRQGTAGAGYPGAAAGWTPLMIASVPALAADNDAITFWDVRPLISDREFQPFALTSDLDDSFDVQGYVNNTSTGLVASGNLAGHATVKSGGRRLGGRLRRGSPGTDTNEIDLFDSANQATDFSLAADARYHVYLVTMFGLPRWARCNDAVVGDRLPRSPRGIPIATMIEPDSKGNPIAPITLPAVFGFNGATTSTGKLIVAGQIYDATGDGRAPTATTLSGRWQNFGSPYTNSIIGVTQISSAGPATTHNITLTPGTHFPRNARRLRLAISLNGEVSGGANSYENFDIDVKLYSGAYVDALHPGFELHRVFRETVFNSAGGAFSHGMRREIVFDVPNRYPSANGAMTLRLDNAVGAQPLDTVVVRIIGWEF